MAAAVRCPWLVLTTLLVLLACSGAGAVEELTNFRFYFHEFPSGANATTVKVASLNVNGSTFGDLKVFDNALREGADPSSTLIGRARGLVVFASQDNSGSVTAMEFVFSNYGNYSGSTLASLGQLTVPAVSDRSILGGTGVNGTTFGDLKVFDNALREGQDPSSLLIGRARGLGVTASVDNTGALTTIEFVFSDYGEYTGSTLAAVGHFVMTDTAERSIVGGTGVLRFARGYFTTKIVVYTEGYLVALIDMYFTTAL